MDNLSSGMRLLWYFAVALVISTAFLWLAPLTFHLDSFLRILALMGVMGLWAICLFLIVSLRKSSPILHFLLLFLPFFMLETYTQTHIRYMGQIALWMYTPEGYDPLLIWRFLLTIASFAFLVGPCSLWLTRMLVRLVYKNTLPPSEPHEPLFLPEWTNEEVPKPARSKDFWILRSIGYFYLVYIIYLLVVSVGTSAWFGIIGEFVEVVNVNPLFSIATFSKMAMLTLLAFQATYNMQLRWYATLILVVAHTVALTTSIVFYFFGIGGYGGVLEVAIGLESILVGLLAFILVRAYPHRYRFNAEPYFPSQFSVPATLIRAVFTTLGVLTVIRMAIMLFMHFFVDYFFGSPSTSWQALFSDPEPMLGNTLTAYAVMAMIFFKTSRQEALRKYFYPVLLAGYWVPIVLSLVWLGATRVCVLFTPGEPMLCIPIQPYFVLNLCISLLVVFFLVVLRRMYYNVEYTITSLTPSSAHNIMGIHQSVFGNELDNSSEVMQSVDRYIGTIRGRKRGVLNFPFWLIENVFSWLLGFYPPFSAMSKEEQRYLFRKKLLRPPQERKKAFSPELAELANQMGVAAHAIVLFATYSNIKKHFQIGYVLPGARDRLQNEYVTAPPPFQTVAPLPTDENDPANYQNRTVPTPASYRLVAPRVSTPIHEPLIPAEVDYLIVGSGPGGAVMAYRLASAHPNARILVVERGNRYSPLQDFNDREMEMMAKVYKEGGLQQTKRANMFMMQGECVGGGSVINNAVCYHMPNHVRNQWQNRYGINLTSLNAEYARIATELNISPLAATGINQRVAAQFMQGISQFNASHPSQERLQHPQVADVNASNEIGDGLWNVGNRYLRKRSVLETYIPWAESRGTIGSKSGSAQVSVVSNTDAVRFMHANNRADSVILRTATGGMRSVKVNKAVIVAGGAIASSHFLMRSGVKGAVGQRMSCNFAFPMAFSFDEEIKAFDGEQITMGAFDPDQRVIFETYFNPPSTFALSLPFHFDRHYDWMRNYTHLLNFGVLVGSESRGIIEPQADLLNGQAFSWSLGEQDKQNIKYGLSTLLEIGLGTDAKQAVIPTQPGILLDLTKANVAEFQRRLAQYPLAMNELVMSTAHPQGGNYMAGNRAATAIKSQRVVDEDFRVQGFQRSFDNVFVADASLFPTSIHVNPQWTIMALSSLASQRVLALCP